MTRRRTVGDDVLLGPERAAEDRADAPVTVLASGNLALISLRDEPGRVPRERIDALYPRLLPTLLEHPGVGFVLVDTRADGPVVLSRVGRLVLRTGAVVGTDPLAEFDPHAREKVLRTHGFSHCADIMVNSLWDPQTEEVAAFEELVGSHGGLGGGQSHPFVLHPADLSMPEHVLGAGALHQVLRRWLASLGQSAYADPTSPGVPAQPAPGGPHASEVPT